MKGEKHTIEVEKRLRELIQVLKDNPFKSDREITPSIQNLLTEINENLYKLSYYAEDWRKSSYLTKKSKGSDVRHKIMHNLQALINMTHLFETVAQLASTSQEESSEFV